MRAKSVRARPYENNVKLGFVIFDIHLLRDSVSKVKHESWHFPFNSKLHCDKVTGIHLKQGQYTCSAQLIIPFQVISSHSSSIFFIISFNSVVCHCIILGLDKWNNWLGQVLIYYMTWNGQAIWNLWVYVYIVLSTLYLIIVLNELNVFYLLLLYMLFHSLVVHAMFINFHKIIRASVLHFVITVITAIILTLMIIKNLN